MILKNDGYIWGPWVWHKIGGHQEPDTIKCRFVLKSIFFIPDMVSIPNNFFIDIKEKFEIISVKNGKMKLYKDREYYVEVYLHTPAEEIKFMETTDFSCNLVDVRRDGMYLRSVPRSIAFYTSPFNKVVDDIRTKNLVITSANGIIGSLAMLKDGWSMKSKGIISDTYVADASQIKEYHYKDIDNECSICHQKLKKMCVRTKCAHVFHHECISNWLDNGTCPMCRDPI